MVYEIPQIMKRAARAARSQVMFDRAEAFAAALRRDLERGRREAQVLLKPDGPISAALKEADKAALNKIAKVAAKAPAP